LLLYITVRFAFVAMPFSGQGPNPTRRAFAARLPAPRESYDADCRQRRRSNSPDIPSSDARRMARHRAIRPCGGDGNHTL
jgi:hypothetical protein